MGRQLLALLINWLDFSRVYRFSNSRKHCVSFIFGGCISFCAVWDSRQNLDLVEERLDTTHLVNLIGC